MLPENSHSARINHTLLRTATPYILYAIPAFCVLLPLLSRGYVLSLDMVFTPSLRMPVTVSNDYPFRMLLHVLNLAVPSDVIEKLLLLTILVTSGTGLYKLLGYVIPRQTKLFAQGEYFAGILYMINPFTYDRFMSGQYEVLLGYALIPWFSWALLRLLDSPSLKSSVTLLIISMLVSITSIHSLGLMLIVAICATGAKCLKRHGDKLWLRRTLKYAVLTVCAFLLLNSYWLLPLVQGHGVIASSVSSYGTTDQLAFATLGNNPVAKLGNVIRLQGFWAENLGLYRQPQLHTPAWNLLSLIILSLVVTGGMSLWHKKQKFLVALFGIIWLLSVILASGILESWLVSAIPFFSGYREPEKFAALIALTYAVFAGQGIAVILQYCSEQGGRLYYLAASFLLILIPLVWTPTMFWGFNGQLFATQYPTDWAQVNRQLDGDHTHFNVLFLPWHLYMYFNFAGRIIANPAPAYFDKPTLVSSNPEFRNISFSQSTPTELTLNTALTHATNTSNLANELAQLNIKYVLLAKDDDFASYGFLDHQRNLKLVTDTPTIKLYRVQQWREP